MFGFTKYDLRLLFNLLRMMVRDRYLGSRLGSLWAISSPLLMLAIFTYVFGFVYQSRLPGAETTLTFVIWMISGYGSWLSISEALNSSTNSVVGSSGIIKNLAFKWELLPIAGALIGLINLAVALVFLLILTPFSGGEISWVVFFVPLVIVVQFTFLIAVGIFLSIVAVFVRDIVQALPSLLLVILFATPIFYSIERTPVIAQKIATFNPIYHCVQSYRKIFVHNEIPDLFGLALVMISSLLLLYFSLRAFRRTKGHFDAAL